MYSRSRFTPTVAGYYQINAGIYWTNANGCLTTIYKNGSEFKRGQQVAGLTGQLSAVSGLVYCNGSTDYVEIYGLQQFGTSQNTVTGSNITYFQGCLVRSA